jgi:hypothetical protein
MADGFLQQKYTFSALYRWKRNSAVEAKAKDLMGSSEKAENTESWRFEK